MSEAMRCAGCPHRNIRRCKIVPGVICPADLMVVGEGPGDEEVKQGMPFVGPSGKLLTSALLRAGWDSGAATAKSNATLCRPPRDHKIADAQVQGCSSRLHEEIKAVQPKVILALGNHAYHSITGLYSAKITQVHGTTTDYPGVQGCKVLACLHPAAVLRKGSDYARFQAAINYAVELATGRSTIKHPGETKYTVVKTENLQEILRKLAARLPATVAGADNRGLNVHALGCDIETTGFNPRSDRIIALGMAWEKNKVLIFPGKLLEEPALRTFLEEAPFKFVWHNGKFDVSFLKHCGIQARIDEDVMLMHYCLAPGTKVLKRDLTWMTVEKLAPGDELIGCDEQDTSVLKPSTVLATSRLTAPCYRIRTDKGEVLCSENHMWAVFRYGQPTRRWCTTKELYESNGQAELSLFAEPWWTDGSYEGGYIAGILDGEGQNCFAKTAKTQKTDVCALGFSQKEGLVLEQVLQYLKAKGFKPRVYFSASREGEEGVVRCVFNSKDSLRAVGMFRPARFLHNTDRMWEGRRKCQKTKILSIEYVGQCTVIGIETSTRTLIAEGFLSHNSINEIKGTHDLEQLATECLGAPEYKGTVDKYKKNGWRGCSSQLLCKYLAADCDYTLQLWNVFRTEIRSTDGLEALYREVLLRASQLLIEVEANGIWANPDHLRLVRSELEPRKQSAYTRLQEAVAQIWPSTKTFKECGSAPPTINPNSWKQVSQLLYRDMGLQVPKGYEPNTSETTLKVLPPNPVTEAILGYRGYTKAISTYVDGIEERIDPKTGRVHATYLIHGTVTGRLSSRNPNLQNIPRDPLLRGIFQAPPGKKLLETDLDQAELRVLGNLSKDPELIRIYREGRKLHHEVALEMYGEGYTPDQYIRAKAINFGIMYGRGAQSLVKEFGGPNIPRADRLTLSAAEDLISIWFNRFPVAYEFVQECRQAPVRGTPLRSVTGRMRRFGLITDRNIHELQNEAANFPIQSAASDITLISAYRVRDFARHLGGVIVNLVHDSIVFEIPDDEATAEAISRATAHHFKQVGFELFGDAIPMEAEFKVGQKWGSLQKVRF